LLYRLRRKEKMGRGRKGPVGLKAREGEEGRWVAHCCWAAGVAGPRARKERREGEKRGVWRERFGFLFQFFSNLFNFSNFQDLNSFPKFSNHFKTFKTSHKQTKPCIQIMMHKHLLLLN
jgi:hypothetical protein